MAGLLELFGFSGYYPAAGATDHGDGGKHTVFDTWMDSDDPLPAGREMPGAREMRVTERKRWGVDGSNFLGGSGLKGGRKE
jgi:hypothetical protein